MTCLPSSIPSSPSSRLPLPSSCFYDILPTPYGGRGAFATTRIAKNTTILQCQGPYASVVLRKFRREVCAWCFAWCFECPEGRKNSWTVKLNNSVEGNKKGKGGNGSAWTPWFCGERCRDEWVADHSAKGWDSGVEQLVLLMNTFEKTLVTYRSTKSKSRSQPKSAVTPSTPHAFAFLETWTPEDISKASVDSLWKLSETLTINAKPSKILEMMESWNDASADDPMELLSEFEADCARFVLDGIVRRALWEISDHGFALLPDEPSSIGTRGPDPATTGDGSPVNVKPTGLWSDLLGLQNNELQHIKSKPYMLGVFIRVYLFLKYIVQCAKPQKKKFRSCQDGSSDIHKIASSHSTLLEALEDFLQTSDSVRAILARDHGNVFGIWEKGLSGEGHDKKEESGDESEMFGWGMYVFGSYFNHDCWPTVRKEQHGRSLHFVTTRDIEEGEELCINYIDVSAGNDVMSRNAELKKEWFFECGCKRCQEERAALSSSSV